MKKKQLNISRAQLNALLFLWEHYHEKESINFLKDIGISFTEKDQAYPNEYIRKYLGEEEYAQYSDTDRR